VAELDLAGLGFLPGDSKAANLGADLLRLVQRPADVKTVERVTRTALTDVGDERLNDDLVARLLIAYRLVLEKPRTDRRVVEVINERLLWFAARSGRLLTERHWDLWARAVAALGQRASRDLQRYVHETKKTTEDPIIRRALQRAEDGLRPPRRADRPNDATEPSGTSEQKEDAPAQPPTRDEAP
jgi:hypothetical protein